MSYFLQLVVSGIVVGAIYALSALGFVLIYKSSRVLNIAHGQLIASGAFITYALAVWVGLPIALAFFLSMIIMFFIAMSVERVFLRRLIGEPIISVIMVTIGLMSILDGLIYLTPFGTYNFSFPEFLPTTPIQVGGVSISWTQLVGVVITAVLIAGFSWFFKKSTLGISMRAVSDDQLASMSIGISIPRVFGLAWAAAGFDHRQHHRSEFRDAARLRDHGVPGGHPRRPGLDRRRCRSGDHHGPYSAVRSGLPGRALGTFQHGQPPALHHPVGHPALQTARLVRNPRD
jgi:hypothetical protein